MTEVPEYLLQRSRERRAALGLETGDAGAEDAPATTAETAPATATETAPATTPAPAPVPVPEAVPEPVREDPPWVKAAKERKRIPVWMAPVAVFIPIWAFMWFGTLEEPDREATGPIGEGSEVYSGQCASCHGAGGGGGVGPQLNAGEVVLTFPQVAEHVAWVWNGSPAAGTPYGAPERGRIALGTMPGFSDIGAEEVLSVVLYERVTHGLQDEAELEAWIMWAESGQLPEWEADLLPAQVEADFQAFVAEAGLEALLAEGEAAG